MVIIQELMKVLRPTIECGDSGLDSLGYVVYNPLIDTYTDTTTITFVLMV